jgi:uncharacterized protein (TIGR02466 family)
MPLFIGQNMNEILEINYWKLPIYISKFRDLTEAELNCINVEIYNYDNPNSANISKNKFILNNESLLKLKNDLNEYLLHFWKNKFNCSQELLITNSWLANTKPKKNHHQHDHKNSILSGVLYINAPKNSGNIVFTNDPPLFKNYHFDYTINQFNEYNSSSLELEVNSGDIIIFASHLRHETKTNNSDQNRLILGFNSFVKGIFDEKHENTTYLKI